MEDAPKKRPLNILPRDFIPDAEEGMVVGPGRFPRWLHRRLPQGTELQATGKILSKHRLHTVCEEAKCPNLLECWSKKTATFLVMGKECTRSCGFCDIAFTKRPAALDLEEPNRVALSVLDLGLKHVVITMVARDDLEDGGGQHLVLIVKEVRRLNPTVSIELLTSDFGGNVEALDLVLFEGRPEVFNHNIETVRSLSERVRHRATYDRTLQVLRQAALQKNELRMKVKSGLMVGFGETMQEVEETLYDLKEAGCDIVTIGHYLQPSRRKLRVKNFIPPETFQRYQEIGLKMGIPQVYAGPFVRSSYHAGDLFLG